MTVQVLEAVLLQLSKDLERERTTDASSRDNEVVILLRFLEHREINAGKLVEALRVATTHKPEKLLKALTVTRQDNKVVTTVDRIEVLR